MYIWGDDGHHNSLLSRSSRASLYGTGPRPFSIHHTNIEVSPEMLRKASTMFSSTSTPSRPSSSTAKLRKQSKDALKASLTTLKTGCETSPVSSTRPLKKKRSLADLLARTSNATDSESSSTSSASTPSVTGGSSNSSSKPAKGKKELPRWPIERPPSETDLFRAAYFQGYGSMSMKNDSETLELLSRFYPSAIPTFYRFPRKSPPKTVLDLGCGPHLLWAKQAVAQWQSHSTVIVCFDLCPPATDQEEEPISPLIKFQQGDFLKRLPFEDDSFDFVRMAGVNLCIPEHLWDNVIKDIYRVLRPGGVLEIIDDEMMWPYLKALPTSPVGVTSSRPTGRSRNMRNRLMKNHHHSESSTHSDAYEEYDRQVLLSRNLEELFEKMLWFDHGIHPRPHEFIQERVTKVFGCHPAQAKFAGPSIFRVALPPDGFEPREKDVKGEKFGPLFKVEWDNKKKPNNRKSDKVVVPEPCPLPLPPPSLPDAITSKAARRLLGTEAPTRLGEKREITGLLFSSQGSDAYSSSPNPDRFAVMEPEQMEMAICKNLHYLLCCSKELLRYMSNLQGSDEGLTHELSVYEDFRRTRFNLPATLNDLKMKECPKPKPSPVDEFGEHFPDAPVKSHMKSPSLSSPSTITIEPLPSTEGLTWVRAIRVFHGIKPTF